MIHKLRAWLVLWSRGEAECGAVVGRSEVTTWWSETTCPRCTPLGADDHQADVGQLAGGLAVLADEVAGAAATVRAGAQLPAPALWLDALAARLRTHARALQGAAGWTRPGAGPSPERPA